MKKKIISIFILMNMIPTTVFAAELELQKKTKLPKMELPKQQELQVPELQGNFDNLVDELKVEGLDNYKYDKNNLEDSIPEVETPKNKGKKAEKVFKEKFGDMWTNKSLDKSNSMPNDSFMKNFRENFAKDGDKALSSLKDKDKKEVSTYLSKKLDTSNLYNLNGIKAKNNAKVPSSSGISNKGFSKGKSGSSSGIPNEKEWLSRNKKPNNFGKRKDIGDYINNLPGIGEISKNINNIQNYKKDANARKNNGGKPTTKDKSWLKNSLKNNFKTLW